MLGFVFESEGLRLLRFARVCSCWQQSTHEAAEERRPVLPSCPIPLGWPGQSATAAWGGSPQHGHAAPSPHGLLVSYATPAAPQLCIYGDDNGEGLGFQQLAQPPQPTGLAYGDGFTYVATSDDLATHERGSISVLMAQPSDLSGATQSDAAVAIANPTAYGRPVDLFIVWSCGSVGGGTGQFRCPQGLALATDPPALFVADMGNDRIVQVRSH